MNEDMIKIQELLNKQNDLFQKLLNSLNSGGNSLKLCNLLQGNLVQLERILSENNSNI